MFWHSKKKSKRLKIDSAGGNVIRFTVPAVYPHITVGQFQAWNEAKNELEKFCAVTGLDMKIVRQLPYSNIRDIVSHFESLLTVPTRRHKRFITIKVPRAKRGYRNVMLGFIPDFDKMTMNEFADSSTFLEEKHLNASLHKLMGMMFRPVTHKWGNKYRIAAYDPEWTKAHQEQLKAIPLEQYNGMTAFFLSLSNELTESSTRSFRKKLINSLRDLSKMIRQTTP